jgi:hypothetical protein
VLRTPPAFMAEQPFMGSRAAVAAGLVRVLPMDSHFARIAISIRTFPRLSCFGEGAPAAVDRLRSRGGVDKLRSPSQRKGVVE